MLVPTLAATLAVLGGFLLVRGVFPAPPRLDRALASLSAPLAPFDPRAREDAHPLGPRDRLGARLVSLASDLGLDVGGLGSDLAVVGTSLEAHLVERLVATVVFGALPPLGAGVASAGGIELSGALVVASSLVLALVGCFVPAAVVRSQAAARRSELRYGLSVYLDLAVIMVAGGAGIESALDDAAGVGGGPAFSEVARTLAACRLTGEAPWKALDRLGADLGVDELRELAASVGLAGTRGARVREALAAKADSMREHQLAEAETDAQAASEKMTVPLVLMLFGFVAFVMYPALGAVLTGL